VQRCGPSHYLDKFLDRLPEKFSSGLRLHIQMYKANRESSNAADSDDDSAFSTSRRMLLQSDLARALKAHDGSVRRKAKELQISTSITDLASTPAQTTQLADLQHQVKVLQERVASRGAGCPCNVLFQASVGGPRTGKPGGPRAIAALHGTRTRGGLHNGTQTSDIAGQGLVGSIKKKIFFYGVQSVTSVEPVGTASLLAFQNCRGRPLNRPGSKIMTDGTSQFWGAIFALAFFRSHRRFSCE